MKLNDLSISTGQGNQMVPLLPLAPKPLESLRDDKICEVLKKVCTYHPVMTNLAVLAKTREQAKT